MKIRSAFTCVVLCISARLMAGEIWVDQASKADKSDGTAGAPFQTIAQAIAAAKGAGDTIVIKQGVYRENLTKLPSGTAEAPFTIKSAPGETVILSGSMHITDWKDQGNQIYSTTIPIAPLQVVLDDQVMPVSREPNEGWWVGEKASDTSFKDAGNLAKMTGDLSGAGAYVWFQMGNTFGTLQIDKIDTDAGTVSFLKGRPLPDLTNGDKYYLVNHPRFIDRPGEWSAIEKGEKSWELFVKAAKPEDLKRFEIPRNASPIIQIFNAAHVVIDGLEITGSGNHGINVSRSNNIRVQNCIIHHNKNYALGVRDVDDFLVRRSILTDNEYGAMFHTVNRATVEECEVARNGIDGVVFSWNSTDVTLRRSYIHDHVLWGHPDNMQTYRNVRNLFIEDNLIQMSGQSLMMEQTYGGKITGNMLIGSQAFMFIFGHRSADDFTLANNTFALAGYGCINFTGKNYRLNQNVFFTGHSGPAYSLKGIEGYVADRNLFWNNQRMKSVVPAASDKGYHRTLAAFQEATGQDAASVHADPLFKNAPLGSAVLDEKSLPKCTASVLILRRGAGAGFQAGDHVELNLDSVVRKITAVDGDSITIDPPLPEKPIKAWLVANWGTTSNFKMDLRLKETSPGATLAEGGKPAGATIDIQAYHAGDFDGDGKRDLPTKKAIKP